MWQPTMEGTKHIFLLSYTFTGSYDNKDKTETPVLLVFLSSSSFFKHTVVWNESGYWFWKMC